MSINQYIDYNDGAIGLEGYLAYDDAHTEKRPGVLVMPDWSGRNAFAENKAEQLAERGYIGFAIDMYGKNIHPNKVEEKEACMQPFLNDRPLLQTRVLAAWDYMRDHPLVNRDKIAAVGFCFGGLCALDLARSGVAIQGVVSVHGLFTPSGLAHKIIHSKILALQGYQDPMVLPDQLSQFMNEMHAADADWQMHVFGKAKHAFTNPLANDPNLGTVYDADADQQSCLMIQSFLSRVFV